MLEHIYLCIDQHLSVITFRRDVLQVGYSPLSLYYILLLATKGFRGKLPATGWVRVTMRYTRTK